MRLGANLRVVVSQVLPYLLKFNRLYFEIRCTFTFLLLLSGSYVINVLVFQACTLRILLMSRG